MRRRRSVRAMTAEPACWVVSEHAGLVAVFYGIRGHSWRRSWIAAWTDVHGNKQCSTCCPLETSAARPLTLQRCRSLPNRDKRVPGFRPRQFPAATVVHSRRQLTRLLDRRVIVPDKHDADRSYPPPTAARPRGFTPVRSMDRLVGPVAHFDESSSPGAAWTSRWRGAPRRPSRLLRLLSRRSPPRSPARRAPPSPRRAPQWPSSSRFRSAELGWS